MTPKSLQACYIVLADDDIDDCFLFEEALEELSLSVHLITVQNGEQLIQLLKEDNRPLPDLLFLDLNMPRKNGLVCLSEIKQDKKLKLLPVIIISTSFERDIINQLYKNGALHYIRKPNDFYMLKNLISQALMLANQSNLVQPAREKFVLAPELIYDEHK